MRDSIQLVEPRRLFASSLAASGVLTINGTDSNDTIVVEIIDRRLAVTINGARERFTLSSVRQITINALAGNDRIDARSIAMPLFVRGAAGNDVIFGGSGDDRLLGDGGNDQLYGGDGSDQLDGRFGSDLLSGGGGRDSVNYSSRTADVIVTIKRGDYDDGERNERDNVRDDIEGITGGSGDDQITGWKASEVIEGGDGHDTLKGDDGSDTINGGDGDDEIEGNGNNDRLSGGDGDDSLDGGNGRNLIYGNAGDDYIDATNDDPRDSVDGGSGHDWADLDAHWHFDHYDFDHERSIEHEDYHWD